MSPATERPGPALLTAVAVGGVLGSLGRYAVGSALPHPAGAWPWATFLVNLTGSLAIGILVGWIAVRPGSHPLLRPFVGVGVLGGWTTFSAFAVDVVQLTNHGRPLLALLYVVASVVTGTLLAGVGIVVGQRFEEGVEVLEGGLDPEGSLDPERDLHPEGPARETPR